MINKETATKIVKKALDFRRDEDIGYMLTDLDIINSILLSEHNKSSFEEVEDFLNSQIAERKKRTQSLKK